MKASKSTILSALLLLATLLCSAQNQSTAFKKEQIKTIADKVFEWQVKNLNKKAIDSTRLITLKDWTNGTLFIGMYDWAHTSNSKSQKEWLKEMGQTLQWELATEHSKHPKLLYYHADEFCIGQFYLAMYEEFKDEIMLANTQKRIDWILDNPPLEDPDYNKNKQSWTWCDAIFMAPPVYAQMTNISGNRAYRDFMMRQLKNTYTNLYDKETKLFYRDNNYFEKREANGEKVFWGRGQGWVVAGLSNLLKQLPNDVEERKLYETTLKEMLIKLIESQDEEGYWHASILDTASYPSPETSATGLITYALAYAINQNLLDKDIYLPILNRAWTALQNAVDEDGKLGWVQPIGQNPKTVTKDMTEVYGVGAFLLVSSEMYKMAQ